MKTAVMCVPGHWIVYDWRDKLDLHAFRIVCICGTECNAVMISKLINNNHDDTPTFNATYES